MCNARILTEDLRRRLPAALELLRQMVGINSYTANPAGVNQLGILTSRHFSELGFIGERVKSVHPSYGDHLVLTRAGRSRRNVALISHLDTVFPPEEEARNNFHWQPEGDVVFGPGTVDIKGGTAMIWLVLSALQQHVPRIFEDLTWNIFLNSSEEVLARDFGSLCKERFDEHTLGALVFEAEGRLGTECLLVTSRKGRASWRVTVTGRGAHAGGSHRQGANAIVQAGVTIEKIARLTEYSRDLTFNIGRVSGGTLLNRVPHEVVLEGEFRAFRTEVYESARSALLSLAGPGEVRSASDGFQSSVKVEIMDEARPWPRNPATEQLFNIWQQAGKALGMEIGSEERGGLSDGNWIWDVVPTLDGLGPWGENDHCSERSADGSKLPEFVEVTSFVPKAVLNVLGILSLAGENI